MAAKCLAPARTMLRVTRQMASANVRWDFREQTVHWVRAHARFKSMLCTSCAYALALEGIYGGMVNHARQASEI